MYAADIKSKQYFIEKKNIRMSSTSFPMKEKTNLWTISKGVHLNICNRCKKQTAIFDKKTAGYELTD